MAQCSFCGAQTVLYHAEKPICVACDDAREQAAERVRLEALMLIEQEPPNGED